MLKSSKNSVTSIWYPANCEVGGKSVIPDIWLENIGANFSSVDKETIADFWEAAVYNWELLSASVPCSPQVNINENTLVVLSRYTTSLISHLWKDPSIIVPPGVVAACPNTAYIGVDPS